MLAGQGPGDGQGTPLCVVESVFCCWRRWNHGPEVAECSMKEWDSEMGVKTVNQFCAPGCVCKRFVFFGSQASAKKRNKPFADTVASSLRAPVVQIERVISVCGVVSWMFCVQQWHIWMP